MKCDVTSEDEVKASIEKAVAHFGALHAAIACAGVAIPFIFYREKEGKITTLNSKLLKKTIDINVYGSIWMAKYAAVAMAKNQPINDLGEKGVIVFTSSIAAEEGSVAQAAYGASKGAINGLLIPMARDLGAYGIRVVAISPATFETPMSSVLSPKMKKMIDLQTPVGRMGRPAEFSHMVATVVENSYINGVRLRLDGGFVGLHTM